MCTALIGVHFFGPRVQCTRVLCDSKAHVLQDCLENCLESQAICLTATLLSVRLEVLRSAVFVCLFVCWFVRSSTLCGTEYLGNGWK